MQTPSLRNVMFSTTAVSQLRRPPRRQRVRHQACPVMRQGFYTHNRIKEELVAAVSHPVGRQITQWLPQANQATLCEPRIQMDHLQHLAQEALVC